MTWQAWLELIDCHDLTYSMSDNGAIYKRGSEQMRVIREAAQQFGQKKVQTAWNAMCDRRNPKHGSMFYWPD